MQLHPSAISQTVYAQQTQPPAYVDTSANSENTPIQNVVPSAPQFVSLHTQSTSSPNSAQHEGHVPDNNEEVDDYDKSKSKREMDIIPVSDMTPQENVTQIPKATANTSTESNSRDNEGYAADEQEATSMCEQSRAREQVSSDAAEEKLACERL